jgi:K+-transporting ATPase ATPase C chain
VQADLNKLQAENPGVPVPIDLVTASASGIDPDISPAATQFQIPRIAKARKISVERLRALVETHTVTRQFGILGEPRVNVLELNRDLDASFAAN